MSTNIPIVFNKVVEGSITDQPNQVYFIQNNNHTTAVITDQEGVAYPLDGQYQNARFVPFVINNPEGIVSLGEDPKTQVYLKGVDATATVWVEDVNFDTHGLFWLMVHTQTSAQEVSIIYTPNQDRLKLTQAGQTTVLYRVMLQVEDDNRQLLLVDQIEQPQHFVVGNGFTLSSDTHPQYNQGKIEQVTQNTTTVPMGGIPYHIPGYTITGTLRQSIVGTMMLCSAPGTRNTFIFMAMGDLSDIQNNTIVQISSADGQVVKIVMSPGWGSPQAQSWFELGYDEPFGIILAPGAISITVGGLTKTCTFEGGSSNFKLINVSLSAGLLSPLVLYFDESTLDDQPLTIDSPYTYQSPFGVSGATLDAQGAPIWQGGVTYLDAEQTQSVPGFKLTTPIDPVLKTHMALSLPRPQDAISSLLVTTATDDNVSTDPEQTPELITAMAMITPDNTDGVEQYKVKFTSAAPILNRPGVYATRTHEEFLSDNIIGGNSTLDVLIDPAENKMGFFINSPTGGSSNVRWLTSGTTLPTDLAIVSIITNQANQDNTTYPLFDAYAHQTQLPLPVPPMGYWQQRPNVAHKDKITSSNVCYYNRSNKDTGLYWYNSSFSPLDWEPTQGGNSQIRIAAYIDDQVTMWFEPVGLDPAIRMVQSFFVMPSSNDVGDYDIDLDDLDVLVRIERTAGVDAQTGHPNYTYDVRFYNEEPQQFVFPSSSFKTMWVYFSPATGTLMFREDGQVYTTITYSGPNPIPHQSDTVATVFGFLDYTSNPGLVPEDSGFSWQSLV